MQKWMELFLLAISIILFVSCGENIENDNEKTINSYEREFNLTANDQMRFNLKEIIVKEGDLIKVNFENIGRMAKNIMGHNFILLKQYVDLAAFAAKAMTAKENEYIPSDETDKIIVFTKLLGPGENTTIEFTAPAKGIYKYICSFPGHYISMQGTLIVR
jgi:azurin